MNTRKPTRNELAEAKYELELELQKLAAADPLQVVGVTPEQMKDAIARAVARVLIRRAVRAVLKPRHKKRRKRRRG